MKKKQEFTPEFLYIPYLVMDLDPADRFVFGAIYYFERMKGERCFASNEELARIAKISVRTVGDCLTRLEINGFIKRTYKDKNKRVRKEIKCLIKLKKVSFIEDTSTNDTSINDTGIRPQTSQVSSTNEQISNNINKNDNKDIAIVPIADKQPSKNIQEFINLFKAISPTNYKDWFGRPPERKAAEKMLEIYDLDKWKIIIEKFLPILNTTSYNPKDCKAYKPTELLRNLDKIKDKIKELNNKGQENKPKILRG